MLHAQEVEAHLVAALEYHALQSISTDATLLLLFQLIVFFFQAQLVGRSDPVEQQVCQTVKRSLCRAGPVCV